MKNSAEIPIPDHAKVRKANKIGKRCCCRDCRLGFTKAVSLNGDSKKPIMINQDTAFSKKDQTESVEETPDEEKEETPTKAHSWQSLLRPGMSGTMKLKCSKRGR